ncbi:4Fe-4S binding protein, partial [Candidatus Aerophobetes bacterium]|nr:4Fe-4S binding protein [Candidatus Aerophobetes bacterium]
MAIKEVWIDEDACTGCGLCEDTCPEVFEMEDDV